jgi:hypothetical protein
VVIVEFPARRRPRETAICRPPDGSPSSYRSSVNGEPKFLNLDELYREEG